MGRIKKIMEHFEEKKADYYEKMLAEEQAQLKKIRESAEKEGAANGQTKN